VGRKNYNNKKQWKQRGLNWNQGILCSDARGTVKHLLQKPIFQRFAPLLQTQLCVTITCLIIDSSGEWLPFKKAFSLVHPKKCCPGKKRRYQKFSWYSYNVIMILKHWLLVVIIVRLLAVDAVVEVLSLISKIFILVLLNDLTKLSFIWKRLRQFYIYLAEFRKAIAFYAIYYPFAFDLLHCLCIPV